MKNKQAQVALSVLFLGSFCFLNSRGKMTKSESLFKHRCSLIGIYLTHTKSTYVNMHFSFFQLLLFSQYCLLEEQQTSFFRKPVSPKKVQVVLKQKSAYLDVYFDSEHHFSHLLRFCAHTHKLFRAPVRPVSSYTKARSEAPRSRNILNKDLTMENFKRIPELT